MINNGIKVQNLNVIFDTLNIQMLTLIYIINTSVCIYFLSFFLYLFPSLMSSTYSLQV